MIVWARRWRLAYALGMSTKWFTPTIWTAFLVLSLYFLHRQSVEGRRLLAIAPVLLSVANICHGLEAFVTRPSLRRSLYIVGLVLMVGSAVLFFR